MFAVYFYKNVSRKKEKTIAEISLILQLFLLDIDEI